MVAGEPAESQWKRSYHWDLAGKFCLQKVFKTNM